MFSAGLDSSRSVRQSQFFLKCQSSLLPPPPSGNSLIFTSLHTLANSLIPQSISFSPPKPDPALLFYLDGLNCCLPCHLPPGPGSWESERCSTPASVSTAASPRAVKRDPLHPEPHCLRTAHFLVSLQSGSFVSRVSPLPPVSCPVQIPHVGQRDISQMTIRLCSLTA